MEYTYLDAALLSLGEPTYFLCQIAYNCFLDSLLTLDVVHSG